MTENQLRKNISLGQTVRVAVKKNGVYQEELVEGQVLKILTNSQYHYHGIKVRLEDGTVGRVKEIIPN